jgi:hypothetical protein
MRGADDFLQSEVALIGIGKRYIAVLTLKAAETPVTQP